MSSESSLKAKIENILVEVVDGMAALVNQRQTNATTTADSTDGNNKVVGDELLLKIAEALHHNEAITTFMLAKAKEKSGDMNAATKFYKTAHRMWPALKSKIDDVYKIPKAVLVEARNSPFIDWSVLTDKFPMGTDMETPRFHLTEQKDEWLSYLEEHGYCVIADVANEEQMQQGKDLLWDFLEGCVPSSQVNRTDMSTWGKFDDWPVSTSTGIISQAGIGQSNFAWHARLLPGVKQAFADIWNDDDLLVSFDGANVFLPWQQAGRLDWKTRGLWWHVDQNACLPGRDGRVTVQGIVAFTDTTPATGGLCVIPGSHKHHKKICERADGRRIPVDFLRVRRNDKVLADKRSKLVCAKAGDLLLWDSRCVHCNTPALLEDFESKPSTNEDKMPQLLRLVGYVCMTPAAWASQKVLSRRKEKFLNNITTNHWPHEDHGDGQIPQFKLPSKSWSQTPPAQKCLVVGASSSLLNDD